ncbi:hypothetical protein CTZ27_15260 [Streptomyces griseocarneus]|nr:hypothetical protein CTZ27_15260 [Streptomyces griseocarneus]
MNTPQILLYVAQGYFHQDCDLEADEPIGVVDNFREEEDPGTVDQLRHAIESALMSGISESELAYLWLEKAGAMYDLRDDGLEIAAWLRLMVEHLK